MRLETWLSSKKGDGGLEASRWEEAITLSLCFSFRTQATVAKCRCHFGKWFLIKTYEEIFTCMVTVEIHDNPTGDEYYSCPQPQEKRSVGSCSQEPCAGAGPCRGSVLTSGPWTLRLTPQLPSRVILVQGVSFLVHVRWHVYLCDRTLWTIHVNTFIKDLRCTRGWIKLKLCLGRINLDKVKRITQVQTADQLIFVVLASL